MASKPQIIFDGGRPAFAVIPFADYLRLAPEMAEAYLSDEDIYDCALASDDGMRIPHAVVARIVAGDNPIAVYRKWRGYSQRALAKLTGVSPGYISQIERGRRQPSHKLRAQLATVLDLDPGLFF